MREERVGLVAREGGCDGMGRVGGRDVLEQVESLRFKGGERRRESYGEHLEDIDAAARESSSGRDGSSRVRSVVAADETAEEEHRRLAWTRVSWTSTRGELTVAVIPLVLDQAVPADGHEHRCGPRRTAVRAHR